MNKKKEAELNIFINGLGSLKDLFESTEYYLATRKERLKMVHLAQRHMFNKIKDNEEKNTMIKEGHLEIIRLVGMETLEEIDTKLSEIEDPQLKILFLEKKIAERIHDEAIVDLECGFMFEIDSYVRKYNPLLKVLSGKLELLKKDYALITKSQNIEGNDLENIKTLDSISSKLVLLNELGVYDLLEKRINENTKSKTDLEKLVSYIIGEKNPQSVGRYFHNMEIDQKPGGKYSPDTKKAIKEMERVMRDCNIKILGDYSKFTKNE
ncbi:MAG: hypothetical protein IPP06_10240 [Saprospiraceae bacterium]|nr:hypothetical protein [Candidatus Vicinibacter affinis]